ncbi:protein timeless-like isoform X2 [Daphnia carinata]|nr:protein timeless-like isoform X2 [Daphnia carinata]
MPSYSQSHSYEIDQRLQQNEIVLNLFAQGFDNLLMDMMASLAYPEKDEWVVTIIQVIAAIYRNRRVEDIEAHLRKMRESNAVVSFDNDGKNIPWSNSTNSDDQQKMTNEQRWKTNIRNLRNSLKKHLSNERAISHVLAKFTIDFMQNGFCIILKQLPQQLKKKDNHLIDMSHLLWLLVNFLPFTFQLGQKPNFLKDVLTTDLMCYLVWVVVQETENVQLNSINADTDSKPSIRRLHLGVRAVFEYLQALEKYSQIQESGGGKNNFSQCGEEWPFQLLQKLLAMDELRQLFLLLLHHFSKEIQSDQCLFDIICANHVLLLTLERAVRQPEYSASFDLNHHMNQFCTKTIVARYGSALEEFRTNDYLVNESIFTMLRRVGCELGRLDLLCQPIILRPLSKIWEEDFEICDDWHDLIERLVRKFTEDLFNDWEKVCPPTSKSPDKESFHVMESDQLPLDTLAEEIASDHDPLTETYGDIKSLIFELTSAGFNKQLSWIQSSLLTACAARLGIYAGQEFRYAVCCSCVAMKMSSPIVPWTELEAFGLRSERFRYLLQLMGLIPQFTQLFFYPKIPSEWSADILFSFAVLFGPIPDHVDFDLTLVKIVNLPMLPHF